MTVGDQDVVGAEFATEERLERRRLDRWALYLGRDREEDCAFGVEQSSRAVFVCDQPSSERGRAGRPEAYRSDQGADPSDRAFQAVAQVSRRRCVVVAEA